MIYLIFLIPIMAILLGLLMYKYPPKKINYLIGYKTFQSMKNEKNWKFANMYCGKLWIKLGTIMLFLSLILFSLIYFKVIIFNEDVLKLVIAIECTLLLLSVLPVEYKLKNLK